MRPRKEDLRRGPGHRSSRRATDPVVRRVVEQLHQLYKQEAKLERKLRRL